ncbi:MAG: hypothetical protein AB1716_20645, partial [Planctomycetota bacterium]
MVLRSVALLACAVVAAGAPAQDLEQVQKQIQAAWEKQKSMSAKIELTVDANMGAMSMSGRGEGTTEFLRKDGKILTRTELKHAITQKMGEQERKMEQSQLAVSDGETQYILMEMEGQKTVQRGKVRPHMVGEPRAFFEQLREERDLKLVGEEALDGRKTWVFEILPKGEEEAGEGKARIYFDQATGFLIKQVTFGPEDKPMQSMVYRDIKTDVTLD